MQNIEQYFSWTYLYGIFHIYVITNWRCNYFPLVWRYILKSILAYGTNRKIKLLMWQPYLTRNECSHLLCLSPTIRKLCLARFIPWGLSLPSKILLVKGPARFIPFHVSCSLWWNCAGYSSGMVSRHQVLIGPQVSSLVLMVTDITLCMGGSSMDT